MMLEAGNNPMPIILWLQRQLHTHTVEYSSTMKRNMLSISATMITDPTGLCSVKKKVASKSYIMYVNLSM
jgi:hypothetical protein